jgi:carbon storage regulator
MLILSRDISQSIVIGDDIEIMILGIARGQVRLGIAAPKTTTVHRKEIWNKIKKEKQEKLRQNYLELLTEHGGEDDDE